MSNEQKQRFEDYPKVDCTDCQHWYNDVCDGAPRGSERRCNGFLATRNRNIPEDIKKLQKRVDELDKLIIVLSVTLILHLIGHLINCW